MEQRAVLDVRNTIINLLVFPVTLTVGITLIPLVTDYGDHHLAAQGVEQTARWFLGHLIAAVAFGLSLLSVAAVEARLDRISYQLPSFIKVIMAVGAGLYAAGLGADGIGPVAVRASTGDATLFFDGSGWFVSGTFMVATVFFGVGLISLVGHANNAGAIQGWWRYAAFISTLLFTILPAVPSGWGLYGEALASWGVFLPLALPLLRKGQRRQ
jgi:hypothetical protein